MTKEEQRYEQYMGTAAGKLLLTQHSLEEEGVWQVWGEDRNPSMFGGRDHPNCGLYRGKLKNVIRKAVMHPNFFEWGGGGDFELVEIVEVEDDVR